MGQTEILARVKKVVAKELDREEGELRPESRFTEDLGADSLDLVQLVVAFEEEFDADLKAAGVMDGISDEDAEKLATVQDVVAYIIEKGH